MVTTVAVEVSGLTYSPRRGRKLFSDFSLNIPRGRVVLLGPNGAGKSTLMRVLCGAVRPRHGRVVIHTPGSDRPRPVAMMPQDIAPIPGFRCREQVAYHAWLQGVPATRCESAADEALRTMGLEELSSRRTEAVSGGELRRVGLAQAWVTTPTVLLLDEPTAGLDPGNRRRLRRLLTELSSETSCCLVSTHLVDDLEDTYDHVIVLADGSVRYQGSVASFMSLCEGDPETAYDQAVSGAL